MLVRFVSSETGELMMFAEVAHQLLGAIGKAGTARGAITADEMLPAAAALRRAVECSGAAAASEDEEDESSEEKPVALSRRAWPFIDMLERTAQGGQDANIVWEAPSDF